MTTAVCPPLPIPLHRPWWQRVRDAWQEWRSERSRSELERDLWQSLGGLSEGTLRDIGAPEWLHEVERGVELKRLESQRW